MVEFTGDIKLSAQLAARALRDVEKVREIFQTPALRTFCDIGRNRDCGTLNLILECELCSALETLEDLNRHATSALPNVQIFERLISHT